MTWLLIANAFMSWVVFFVSYNQSTTNALSFYQSTLITIFHAVVAGTVALAGLIAKRAMLVFVVISSVLLTTLPISCAASARGYSPGDDGGSLGWLVYVGVSSLLAAAIGISTLLIGIILHVRTARARSARLYSEVPPLPPR